MTTSPQRQEKSLDLNWAANALLAIYAVTVLAAALPVSLHDPAWFERVAGSLRGGVSFPLIALALLYVSAYLRKPDEEITFLPLVSRLAYLAALGFFLLIPLQTAASVKLLHQASEGERDQLKVFNRGLEGIRRSRSQEELSEAIASIPGAPRFTPGTLSVPLPEARQSLIRQIEPQLRQRASQLKAAESKRWQPARVRLIKDALVSLFAGIAFAAAARRSPRSATLLETLILPALNPTPPSADNPHQHVADDNDQPVVDPDSLNRDNFFNL